MSGLTAGEAFARKHSVMIESSVSPSQDATLQSELAPQAEQQAELQEALALADGFTDPYSRLVYLMTLHKKGYPVSQHVYELMVAEAPGKDSIDVVSFIQKYNFSPAQRFTILRHYGLDVSVEAAQIAEEMERLDLALKIYEELEQIPDVLRIKLRLGSLSPDMVIIGFIEYENAKKYFEAAELAISVGEPERAVVAIRRGITDRIGILRIGERPKAVALLKQVAADERFVFMQEELAEWKLIIQETLTSWIESLQEDDVREKQSLIEETFSMLYDLELDPPKRTQYLIDYYNKLRDFSTAAGIASASGPKFERLAKELHYKACEEAYRFAYFKEARGHAQATQMPQVIEAVVDAEIGDYLAKNRYLEAYTVAVEVDKAELAAAIIKKGMRYYRQHPLDQNAYQFAAQLGTEEDVFELIELRMSLPINDLLDDDQKRKAWEAMLTVALGKPEYVVAQKIAEKLGDEEKAFFYQAVITATKQD